MKTTSLAIFGVKSLPNTLLQTFLTEQGYKAEICETPESTLNFLTNTDTSLTLVDHNTSDAESLISYGLSTTLGKSGKLMTAVYNVDCDEILRRYAYLPSVNGVFKHDCPQEMLLKGISSMLKGHIWLPRYVLEEHLVKHRVLQPATKTQVSLTKREREILELLATGIRNTDIAENLNLSPHTVKTHIYNIFKKINASNRLQAVNWAKEHLLAH